jgi:hypothetical protein
MVFSRFCQSIQQEIGPDRLAATPHTDDESEL